MTVDIAPGTFVLTLDKVGSGSGTVTSSPSGVECGPSCNQGAASFTEGETVTLTASAASGSIFLGWDGDCSGVSSCDVAMTQARSVTAHFNAEQEDGIWNISMDPPSPATMVLGEQIIVEFEYRMSNPDGFRVWAWGMSDGDMVPGSQGSPIIEPGEGTLTRYVSADNPASIDHVWIVARDPDQTETYYSELIPVTYLFVDQSTITINAVGAERVLIESSHAECFSTTTLECVVEDGETVELIAPKYAGLFQFASWQGCDSVSGPDSRICSVSVDESRSLTVNYSPLPPVEKFQHCDTCPPMVIIPGGSFVMGCPDDEPGCVSREQPQRTVHIQSFAIGETPVTFAQWEACYDAGGCSHMPDDRGWGRADWPVFNLNWYDAQEYVTWLSEETGKSYRLPSEAEWEYSARARTTTPYHTGRCITDAQANFRASSAHSPGCPTGTWLNETVPVYSFEPNSFGLYDTHGNVTEWVQDCWIANYHGAPTDGSSWEFDGCSSSTVRSVGYYTFGVHARSASRAGQGRTLRDLYVPGFRVAKSLDEGFGRIFADGFKGESSTGVIRGIKFEGTVSGISGDATWASDMRLDLTSPDSQEFAVGGFGSGAADISWEFTGSGSSSDGTYTSQHGNAFPAGAEKSGTWVAIFTHTWSGGAAMSWSQVSISLLDEGGAAVGWLCVPDVQVAPGSPQVIQLQSSECDFGAVNTIRNISMTPSSPAQLEIGSQVAVSFDYEMSNSEGFRVWAVAYSQGMPGASQGSPLHPAGEGSLQRVFAVNQERVVDEVRVVATNPDQSETFFETFIPVDYVFGNPNAENLVADGGFEEGSPNPYWNEYSTNFDSPICTLTTCPTWFGPHSGTGWAWFGGHGGEIETGILSQQVTIPSGSSAQLQFQLAIPTTHGTGFLRVSIDDQEVFFVNESDGSAYPTYQPVTVNLEAFADGSLQTLQFESVTQDNGTVNFFLDDVKIIVQ